MSDRPDLAALVARYQRMLGLQAWTIRAEYVPEIAMPCGAEAFGSMRVLGPNCALMLIRDPEAPPAYPGHVYAHVPREVSAVVCHEMTHLRLLAGDNETIVSALADLVMELERVVLGMPPRPPMAERQG